jgi:hypothetical protein
MREDFLVGASPLHDGDMLKLGLRQLAESEVLLRKLLVAYEQTKAPQMAKEIAQECAFISQTLDALTDMTISQPGPNIAVSGALLRASRYLRQLVEEAERAIGGTCEANGRVA